MVAISTHDESWPDDAPRAEVVDEPDFTEEERPEENRRVLSSIRSARIFTRLAACRS